MWIIPWDGLNRDTVQQISLVSGKQFYGISREGCFSHLQDGKLLKRDFKTGKELKMNMIDLRSIERKIHKQNTSFAWSFEHFKDPPVIYTV